MSRLSGWTARAGLSVLVALTLGGFVASAQVSMDGHDSGEPNEGILTPGSSVGAESQVPVTTDKARYGPREPIVVTVTSTLPNPIFTLTGRSYCTGIAVQRRESDEWRSIGPCISGEPRVFVPI